MYGLGISYFGDCGVEGGFDLIDRRKVLLNHL